MDRLEIIYLLEEIYKEDFLSAIEIIVENESKYRKSDFYKKTKIGLSELYQKYFIHYNSKYSFEDKMNDFITNIDVDKLTNLAIEWIQKLEEDDRIKQILENIIEAFNSNQLNSEELKGLLEEFKKLQ